MGMGTIKNKIILKSVIAFIIACLPSLGLSQSALFKPFNSNFYMLRSGNHLFTIHQSKFTNWRLNKNFQKLSSGKRINSAADDAAAFAVAEKFDAALRAMRQEAFNLEDYRNYLRYAEGVITQNYNLVKQIRILILRAGNGILSRQDRGYIQQEIDQYLAQINMNAKFSTFNKKVVIPQLNVQGLGLDKVNVVRNLYGSIKPVDQALKRLMRRRVLAGIKSNVLAFQIKGKYLYMVNMTQAQSRMSDTDFASELSKFHTNKAMFQTQYGVMMLQKK